MTVQELIDKLEEVEGKSIEVYGLGVHETFIINNLNQY